MYLFIQVIGFGSIHNCMYVVYKYVHTTKKSTYRVVVLSEKKEKEKKRLLQRNADVTDEKCTKTGVLFPAYY